MWLKVARPLALLAVVAGIGSGIVASQDSYDLNTYSPRPGGCGSSLACASYCSAHPGECRAYCRIDSVHAADCASWRQLAVVTATADMYSGGSYGSYTPPSGSNYQMPSGGTTYTLEQQQAMCSQAPGCTWKDGHCDCSSTTTYSNPGTPGTVNPAPSAGAPSAATPTQPAGCFYQQPSPPSTENCTASIDAYLKCDANATRYTSRDKMIENCVGFTGTPTAPAQPTPQSSCPTTAITCAAPLVSCTLPGSGSSCPVCTTKEACAASSTVPNTAPLPASPAPSATTSTAPSVKAPSPPPGCSYVAPVRPNIDNCTVAVDAYTACYPTALQFSSRTKMIQDCSGYHPASSECVLPKCTTIEVTCNPPNDGNPCPVCMSEAACRKAFETQAPNPSPAPEPKPEVKEIKPLPPVEIKPLPPEVARPPCGDVPAKCASYCTGSVEAQKLCGAYCSGSAHQDECQAWAGGYAALRGGVEEKVPPKTKTNEQRPAPHEPNAQQIEQMKKDFQNWLLKFKDIDGRVQRLAARGITIPDDVTAAVATIHGLGEEVSAAATTDDLQALGEKLQDAVQTINESLPGLERLLDFNRLLKSVNHDLARAESQFARLERRAKIANVAADILEVTAKQIAENKENRDAAVAAAQAGDADTAFDSLQSVITALDDIREKFTAIETVLNAPRQLARYRRELAGFSRELRGLEGRGTDTKTLRARLADLTQKLSDLTALARQSPFPAEEMFTGIQDYENMKDEYLLERDNLLGASNEILPPQPTLPLELPKGFEQVELPKGVFGSAPTSSPTR